MWKIRCTNEFGARHQKQISRTYKVVASTAVAISDIAPVDGHPEISVRMNRHSIHSFDPAGAWETVMAK